MARENRDVRPFKVPDDLQDWLEANLLLEVCPVGTNEVVMVEPESTARFDPTTLATCGLRIATREGVTVGDVLKSCKTYSGWLDLEDVAELKVLVLASSKFLAFTDELHRFGLDELDRFESGVDLVGKDSTRPRSFFLPHNGTEVEVVVVLDKALKVVVGRPHRLGTWLARVRFTLANPEEGIGFNPLPLTSEKRAELGLGKQTVTYALVNQFQPDILVATMLDDFVEYYVDEDLLARLSANPRHPQSKVLQTEIFLGAVEFAVLQFQRVEDLESLKFSDVDEFLVGKIVRIVASENGEDLRKWFDVLRSDPSLFLAKVEDVVNYRETLEDSLSKLVGAPS